MNFFRRFSIMMLTLDTMPSGFLAHYASKITSTPKTQAPDLAAFLKKMRVDSFLSATNTYRRKLMKVDFDKKP